MTVKQRVLAALSPTVPATAQQIATNTGILLRTVRNVLADLDLDGVLVKKRVSGRMLYSLALSRKETVMMLDPDCCGVCGRFTPTGKEAEK